MRLINSMRDSIVSQEYRNKFHDALAEAGDKLKRAIEEEYLKQVPKIPEELLEDGWISKMDTIYVTFEGNQSSFKVHNYVPKKCSDYAKIKEPSKSLVKIHKQWLVLNDEAHKFKSELSAVLYSFSTSKQVIEHLPELANYFENENKAKSMAVIPIEQIEKVRKQLKYKRTA